MSDSFQPDLTPWLYLAYLAISIPLALVVGRTLSTHGATFLADVFAEKQELGVAVNRLLLVGFYLLNIGLILMFVSVGSSVHSLTDLIQSLSTKVGFVMLFVGVAHVANIMVLNGIRRRHLQVPAQRAYGPAMYPPAAQAPRPPAPRR